MERSGRQGGREIIKEGYIEVDIKRLVHVRHSLFQWSISRQHRCEGIVEQLGGGDVVACQDRACVELSQHLLPQPFDGGLLSWDFVKAERTHVVEGAIAVVGKGISSR